MNEIVYNKTFSEWQQELDTELVKSAEGFVRIGYLLKVARDTDILKDSGYSSIIEFAKERYGLDKTQVSRFIHINDRFSEGGNSDMLMDKYKGMGYAKLTIMLQLPDAVNEEITLEYSKAEIQTIKDELDEERKISDLELLAEDSDNLTASDEEGALMKVVKKLLEDEPELFETIFTQHSAAGCTSDSIKDDICPNDEKMYFVRPAGMGRMILSLKANEPAVRLISSRTGEKEKYTWQQLTDCFVKLVSSESGPAAEAWEHIYGRPYPKAKVAPVQQPPASAAEEKRPKQRKESKVKVSKPTLAKEAEKPEDEGAECLPEEEKLHAGQGPDESEQISRQMNIQDYPEMLPDKMPYNATEKSVSISEPPASEDVSESDDHEAADMAAVGGDGAAVEENIMILNNKLNESIRSRDYRQAYTHAVELAEFLKRINCGG